MGYFSIMPVSHIMYLGIDVSQRKGFITKSIGAWTE
jgi:hypothetical protein